MAASTLKNKVSSLPRAPGVYLFRDESRKVVYVGKAKSLKDRVSSYFVKCLPLGSKTNLLVESIKDLSFVEVQNELESLLLEAELIKRYRPKFNISLKDDKSYKYIVISNESVSGLKLPVIRTTHSDKISPSPKYELFGPFPEGNTVNQVVRSLRKIIPFRDCSPSKFLRYRKIGSPCLYGHMGLCSAPCVGRISEVGYRKSIRILTRFLRGESKKILHEFKVKMERASRNMKFEEALLYRDLIRKYEYVTQNFRDIRNYISNPNLIEDIRGEALDELVKCIPALKGRPHRIECYDISNISGKNATASLIVALDAKLVRREYRRFRIRLKDTPDDFSMIEEVIERRFKRMGWEAPDLVVVDGGKGQVSAVLNALSELSLDLPVIGLAKRFEAVVFREAGGFSEVRLSKQNEGLKLLMLMRDEAHRFSRLYHHLLRSRELLR